VIVAGQSYGQGSSREHAAMCPAYLGVRVVLAKSFERIHAANLVNFGIMPLVFADESDYDELSAGAGLDFFDLRKTIEAGDRVTVRLVATGETILLSSDLSLRQRKILLAGGMLNYIMTCKESL
jgi:aconitate hydratase